MRRHNSSTSNFRENGIFVGKLFILLAMVLAFFNHMLPQYVGNYNSSLLDKAMRIDSINEPKIVLIGHSGLSFGIDSSMIEETIGMPVVNMGLHGGLGNAFHEEMAKMNVSEGDIYVVCHSSFNDTDLISDAVLAWTTVENHPRLWKLIRNKDLLRMFEAFPTYLKRSLNLYTSETGNTDGGGVYSRSAFNEYGDIKLDRLSHTYKFESVKAPEIGDTTINRLNELNQWLEERGASLVVAGYNIGNGHHTTDVSEFIALQEKLQEQLDCPVISNYVDYMFAYNLFFDTNLHLTNEGVRIRTLQLISDLRKWMETEEEATFDEAAYAEILFDCNLAHITDFREYLSAIIQAKERYVVFISAKDEVVSGLNDEDFLLLNQLGIESLTQQEIRSSFYAIYESGKVTEQVASERIEVSGDFNNLPWSVISAGYDCGNESSIKIRNQEFSYNQRGLNIVVYSITRDRIIDCVSFDTHLSEKPVFRQ